MWYDNSLKGVLTGGREHLPAWHRSPPSPRCQAPGKDAGNDPNSVDHVRSMSEFKSSTAGDEKKMDAYHTNLQLVPLLPIFTHGSSAAVRDVELGNGGVGFPFLVTMAGRNRAFPDWVVLSLSLILLDSLTCFSEEFTELVDNDISSLLSPSPHSLRSRDPSNSHPPLRVYAGLR